ncbi:hypothetical protein ABPG74_017207 [Tetrahymena malaccensis]
MSDLSEIYQDRPTYMDSGESDDSSFQCSSLNSNSGSSYSSTKDFFNMETREDSFLENMYQFVSQCLSNEELMRRLKPKKNINSKDKQISLESSKKSSQISSKYIKKPVYESKIQKQINIIEIVMQNKIQIALFFVSIIMIILRAQDLNSLNEKRNKQACLSYFDINERIDSLKIKDCMEKATYQLNNRSLLQSTKILLLDYNQFFYITIICIALYSIVKNIFSTYSIKSFTDYWNKYQKIHKLNTSSKVKLTELKSDYFQRQSQVNGDVSLKNQNKSNSKKNFKFLGISFSLNFFFLDKNQEKKIY